MVVPWVRLRHLRRTREILTVLGRHGLGSLAALLEPRLPLRPLRPPQPPPVQVRQALEELGGAFIKLGQLLSTRPDLLPPAYLQELARLQDAAPPEPFDRIRAQVEESLGVPLEEAFPEFDPDPLAAASLGQVHAARLADGTEVVVKVRRPEVEKRVEEDLAILQTLARVAAERLPWAVPYDPVGVAEEFAHLIRQELAYRREGRNAERFRQNFAGDERVYVPRVYWDWTTDRVLVMERIRGIKVDDLEGMRAAGIDPKQVARRSTAIIAREIFEFGFFHADPHPGNFFVLPEGVLGIMDFGQMGTLSWPLRRILLELFLAIVDEDLDGILEGLAALGVRVPPELRPGLRRDLGRLIATYRHLPLGEIRAQEVLRETMPLAFRYRLRLPTELWLLAKTTVMMEGVGSRLDPELNIFEVTRPYVLRAMRHIYLSPGRWARQTGSTLTDLVELASLWPRRVNRILEQWAAGEGTVQIEVRHLREALGEFNRAVNRLALSILSASFTVGLALLIAQLSTGIHSPLGVSLLLAGLVASALLGLWLLVSIWRSGRR